MYNGKSVGVAVVTLNGAKELPECLRFCVQDGLADRVLVVDSSSEDGTESVARGLGAEVHVISRSEFNHGATRELARKILKTDIVVFLTQDVVTTEGFLRFLVEPLVKGLAEVSYARQLPKNGADFFESFPRIFNYPPESNFRSIDDAKRLGVYTFFCSDSCAAYVNKCLDEVGGFEVTLTNEDYFAVAKLLKVGYRIAYVAESRVFHSHRYTLKEEFTRYFDTGYVRAENPWVNRLVGHAEGRGATFFREMIRSLWRESPGKIPEAVIQTSVKWLGFRIGYWSVQAPVAWKRRLSGQKYFWGSRFRLPREKGELKTT